MLTGGMLLFSALWIVCGELLAFYIMWSSGLNGWIANFIWIVVFIVGTIGSYVLTVILLERWVRFFYPLPPCRHGRCQGTDYEPRGYNYQRFAWGMYRYRCNCGDYYVRFGKRFLLGHFDEEKRPTYLSPYKKLIGFRKWGDDQDPLR
jgi:hypothetical protein